MLARLHRGIQESRAIRELAGNPLLLTMMAILNRNQELPRDRVELYREASRVLLHEWDASRSLPVDVFGRQEKEGLLRELAGAMQKGEGGLAGNLIDYEALLTVVRGYLKSIGVEDPYEKAGRLVRQLTERNFLLCYAGANRFAFVHRTFLEYFRAAWFVQRFEKDRTLDLEGLKTEAYEPHWKDETWHEVLRLIAGMVGEKQAEQLIRFLMEQDGRSDKLANLMLAAGCLSEVRNRNLVAEIDRALHQRMLREAIRYEPPYFYEEYEEWTEVAPIRGKALSLIASVWRSATGPWLREAVGDHDRFIQIAAVQELARWWKDDPETLPMLKGFAHSNEDEYVRSAAVTELARGWKEDPSTRQMLEGIARCNDDEDVRTAAVVALARWWKDDPGTLLMLKNLARSDENEYVRCSAIEGLARGWKDDSEALLMLKDLARSDENDYVRRRVAGALARGWKDDPETLVLLKDLARSDKNDYVRSGVVEALACEWKNDADTLPLLKRLACSDKSAYVRSSAADFLARG